MALADYALCDRCGKKAFYDSDVDYGDAATIVLCAACSETHYIAFEIKPRGDLPYYRARAQNPEPPR